MARLHGTEALEYAEEHGLLLGKYADPDEDACIGLTVPEAREVWREDPGLVWVEEVGARFEVRAGVAEPNAETWGAPEYGRARARQGRLVATAATAEDAYAAAAAVADSLPWGVVILDTVARVADWGDGVFDADGRAVPGVRSLREVTGTAAYARYVYGPGAERPAAEEAATIGLDVDAAARAAGFDPEDPDLWVGRLTEEWDGHAAGALVVSGLAVEGHPFAVES
jgi:hypothetical protein